MQLFGSFSEACQWNKTLKSVLVPTSIFPIVSPFPPGNYSFLLIISKQTDYAILMIINSNMVTINASLNVYMPKFFIF